ncbi:MAG TPA: hypothetical protein VK832_02030 [Burkholderiaceae bacterium]|jgi:hypothetical protein|nr:hypothetical protein [Burkholderiaceae bacterium]
MKQPNLERIILSFQKLVGIVPVSGKMDERETEIDHMEKLQGIPLENMLTLIEIPLRL